ncbi:isochorismatase hydrolase [Xylariales sp. PMI_506]|nr:isochorismatase hydrolase [Xylariales sp. PMI_506]
MKEATSRKTAIILIDVQNGFRHPTHWGSTRSTPTCEENISRLLSAARNFNKTTASSPESQVLICHVHHHSIQPDSQLHPSKLIEVDGERVLAVRPQHFAVPVEGEPIFVKNVNSSFIGTDLEATLRREGVRQLVICGLTTDHCVSTTTRMAKNLRVVDAVQDSGEVVEEGDIVLVSDACATFAKGGFDAELVHEVNLASLNEEFAQVGKTELVLPAIFGTQAGYA